MSKVASVLSVFVAIALVFVGATAASAHDGKKHAKPKAAATSAAATSAPVTRDFGIKVGGPFALVDHLGNIRTDRDYHGRFLLIFFGYANCESICPVGLKRMTDAVDVLGKAGAAITPILITVDPARDSTDVLATEVAGIHPRLIGLTGTEAALGDVPISVEIRGAGVAG